MNQARFWLLTIPHADFVPYLPPTVNHIVGQLERGDSGYLHWQIVVSFARKLRLGGVKSIFGDSCHAEPTRSAAAREYVHKEDTRVGGTRFELGTLPMRRGESCDWEAVRNNAKRGRLDDIPGDVYCRLYGNLKRIAVDHMAPIGLERTVNVYWGATGTGKSRRAWNEAGMDAFPKDPRTKFWDGYRNHRHVVIDEFRGGIDVAHLLRWFDRYPVVVEVKGSSVVLAATNIWITSNLDPRQWYPDLDQETLAALLRRLTITEFAL
nr:MAG: replication associated protein [Virus sp.]